MKKIFLISALLIIFCLSLTAEIQAKSVGVWWLNGKMAVMSTQEASAFTQYWQNQATDISGNEKYFSDFSIFTPLDTLAEMKVTGDDYHYDIQYQIAQSTLFSQFSVTLAGKKAKASGSFQNMNLSAQSYSVLTWPIQNKKNQVLVVLLRAKEISDPMKTLSELIDSRNQVIAAKTR